MELLVLRSDRTMTASYLRRLARTTKSSVWVVGGAGAYSWAPSASPALCLGVRDDLVDFWDVLVAPKRTPAIATVRLGTNDVSIGYPALSFRSNLEDPLQGLVDLGIGDVLLMTPPPRLDPGLQIDTAAYAKEISNPTRALCVTLVEIRCGPDLFNLLDPETDFYNGNVHPNATGHAKIAAALTH